MLVNRCKNDGDAVCVFLLTYATDCHSNPVDFWVRNKATYDKLLPAVRRTFAIPASSAPVERVFSHGGIVLRPNIQSKNV